MKAFIFLCVFFVLISCDDGAKILYEHKLPTSEWAASDIITGTIEGHAPVYIRLHHTADYPYENLYVKISSDTSHYILSIPLMDDQGLWKGQKSGALFETDFRVEPLDSITSFAIEQYSRTPLLSGISDIQIITKPE